ncbi:MAG: hypothetical protein HOI95_00905, partial [Chromatiales bacterium]|nr:hypothetical protein [Chromatiales bacterium]
DGDPNTTEVISSGVSALKSGKVYLRGNGIEASLINNASSESPPPTGEADWAYRPALYFIRQYTDSPGDGIPSLCRYTLSLTTSFGEEECLAEGIEDLHVEFGIDTDSDGYANLYTGEPSTAQMTAAVTARVHVLARTVRPLPHYTNDKVYNLGNVTLAQKSDGLLRRVYTGTVVLRNTVNRSLIN